MHAWVRGLVVSLALVSAVTPALAKKTDATPGCVALNGACLASTDCCSGFCDPSTSLCAPPCIPDGVSCTSSGACCSGTCDPSTGTCGPVCLGGVAGQPCTTTADCCPGLFCDTSVDASVVVGAGICFPNLTDAGTMDASLGDGARSDSAGPGTDAVGDTGLPQGIPSNGCGCNLGGPDLPLPSGSVALLALAVVLATRLRRSRRA
jgi:hypothetical protein